MEVKEKGFHTIGIWGEIRMVTGTAHCYECEEEVQIDHIHFELGRVYVDLECHHSLEYEMVPVGT